MRRGCYNIALCFMLFVTFVCKAQFFTNEVYNNKAVYVEVFGTGIGATLNYEYLFKDWGLKKGCRLGAGYFADLFDANNAKIVSGNIEYLNFVGFDQHQIEIGLGLTFQYRYYSKMVQEKVFPINGNTAIFNYIDHTYMYKQIGPAIVPRIGYRFESSDGGLLFRIAYTPLIYFVNSEKEFYDGTLFKTTSLPFQTKLAWGGISIGVCFY